MILKAIAVGMAGILGFAGYHLWSSTRSYQVTGYFITADLVVPGNSVVIGGVPAGTVTAVQLAPDGQAAGAMITMSLDRRFAPLQRGTRATIRPKGLLGTMFVELAPGHTGQALPDGGSIPLQDTAAPVTLDQVTDIFDPSTRQRIQTLTRQGGAALAGRGPDVNRVLAALPRISQDLAATTAALDQRSAEIDALQVEFDRVAKMMASEDKALRADLVDGAGILDTLAAHQQELQQEIASADSALTQLNAALEGHQQDLNQLLREMPSLLQQLRSFQGHTATTFSIVDPCMADLETLLAYMRSATDYHDGNGYMLRVNVNPAVKESGQYAPLTRCSGTGG